MPFDARAGSVESHLAACRTDVDNCSVDRYQQFTDGRRHDVNSAEFEGLGGTGGPALADRVGDELDTSRP